MHLAFQCAEYAGKGLEAPVHTRAWWHIAAIPTGVQKQAFMVT